MPVIAEANEAAKWTSTQIFTNSAPGRARPGPSDEPLPLVDALELTIPIAHKDPRRQPRVAARSLLRYLEECDDATIDEAALVAACLAALAGDRAQDAALTLRAMAVRATSRAQFRGVA